MPRIRIDVVSSPVTVATIKDLRDATGLGLVEVKSALQGARPICDAELDCPQQRATWDVLKTIDRKAALLLHNTLVALKRHGATFALACDDEPITEDRLKQLISEEHQHAESYNRPTPGPFAVDTGRATAATEISAAARSADPLLKRLDKFNGDLKRALQDYGVPFDWTEYGLRVLDLGAAGVTDAGLSALRDQQQLEQLSLGSRVTDDGLSWIGNLQSLSVLDLSRTKVRGPGLAHLERLAKLHRLILSGAPIGDAGLATLPGLGSLWTLEFDGCQITDAGLAALQGRGCLSALTLRKTKVTGTGLQSLSGMSWLHTLLLDDSHLDDETIAHFVDSEVGRKVTTLGLAGCALSDEAAAALATLTQLRTLHLGRTLISDAGVGLLTSLKELRWLDLSETAITNDSIEALRTLPKLEHVDLRKTAVTLAGVGRLQDGRETLSISDSLMRFQIERPPEPLLLVPRVDDRDAAPVADSWRRIESWLSENTPDILETLRPPARERDLDAYEELLGRRLPDDVRASWLIHDGQSDFFERDRRKAAYEREPTPGLIFGSRLLSLCDRDDDGSSRRCWESHWDPRLGLRITQRELDEFSEGCSSFPRGMIRPREIDPAWIPVYATRGYHYLGIDLEPGPVGVVGQVIHFGRDARAMNVLALSWAHFLEDLADELEADHAFVTPPEQCGDYNPRFGLRGAPHGWFLGVLAEWSRAKLPGRLFESHADSED